MGPSCGVPTLSEAWSGINNLYPTETYPAAKLVLCETTSCISIMHVWLLVLLLFFTFLYVMDAVIVLAAEDSSHSLARGWRVGGENPIRNKINYSS